jgi:hypothetical protein
MADTEVAIHGRHRSRDAAGEDRFATIVVKLPQLLSFGPFLNPLVLLFIEIAMTSNLFAGFLILANSDDMKTCETGVVLPAERQHDAISSNAGSRRNFANATTSTRRNWE